MADTSRMSDRRMVLVHAHPDDETITNGATMARYSAEGAQVVLVTCTMGEEGEILVPGLSHLAADQEDRLGSHREQELAAAMAALGMTDYRFLGGPGRYRDSGMMGTPSNDRPDSFWRADLREAADHLVEVLREIRPHVLLTYDDFGGYGHPDHIQAHRVATYATALAAVPSYRPDVGESWDVPKVYWSAIPRTAFLDAAKRLEEMGSDFLVNESLDELTYVVPDELITSQVDGHAFLENKIAAMRAHETQISVDSPFFALSNNIGQEAFGSEHYRLVKGTLGQVDPVTGWETDLFAGVA